MMGFFISSFAFNFPLYINRDSRWVKIVPQRKNKYVWTLRNKQMIKSVIIGINNNELGWKQKSKINSN